MIRIAEGFIVLFALAWLAVTIVRWGLGAAQGRRNAARVDAVRRRCERELADADEGWSDPGRADLARTILRDLDDLR